MNYYIIMMILLLWDINTYPPKSTPWGWTQIFRQYLQLPNSSYKYLSGHISTSPSGSHKFLMFSSEEKEIKHTGSLRCTNT